MDSKTTLSELKETVRFFCEERDWDQFHNPKDLAIGVVTEASELIEHFRFKNQQEIEIIMQDKKKKEKIGNELADILFFLLRFSQINEFDLTKELKRKMKLNGKKYPVELSRGSNKKYDEIIR